MIPNPFSSGTPNYGTQQVQDSLGQNADIARQRAQEQADWEQRRRFDEERMKGRIMVDNQALMNPLNNAAANANNARQIAALNAQGLNNMYANAANNLQMAANNTQNNLASLAQTSAGMFR